MAGHGCQDLPLVAVGVLEDLKADLAVPDLYREYLGQYLKMWPRRRQRLVSALQAEDGEALLDAALSIKTSAAMVGALRLECLARGIEHAVRGGRKDRIQSSMEELELCGELTTEKLRLEY